MVYGFWEKTLGYEVLHCSLQPLMPMHAHKVVTTTNPNLGLTSSNSLRFQKTNRLLNAAAFGRVFKKATRSRDKLFTVLSRANTDNATRLGLAISKKHCRKATGRNRIKRMIRESFRHNQAELAGLDIIVINQPAASLADKSAMQESLERHWQRCSSAAHKLTKQDS